VKRTTISLPEEVLDAVARAARQGVTVLPE
jgi:hypothetical protein